MDKKSAIYLIDDTFNAKWERVYKAFKNCFKLVVLKLF